MLGAHTGPGAVGLSARLIGTDRLYAVAAGDDTSDVHAQDAAVLLDDDTTSWASWNLYAGQLARDTGARVVRICDGGITGPAFFDHVRRGRRRSVNSPKGQTVPLPPDLVLRPVIAPQVYWTWSLVWCRGEERTAVLAAVHTLTDGVGFQKPVTCAGQQLYAARSYSLINPPSTCRRLICSLLRSATGWVGRGGRSPRARCGRRPL